MALTVHQSLLSLLDDDLYLKSSRGNFKDQGWVPIVGLLKMSPAGLPKISY